uniref:Uncharacterized protein n=1 Tax=Sinocyclocheilus anshuiensis TaxID=1608454 RepID=A0A671PK73_9TELE
TQWSGCDVPCGGGLMVRNRTCSNPPPKNGGRDCEGMSRQTHTCNMQTCGPNTDTQNGGWSDWSSWTDCSKSCGGGVKSRRRDCDRPVRGGDGDYCEGLGTEVILCSTHHCPVDGSWGSWSSWSDCDACAGVSVRQRQCNSPPARFGGLSCLGESRQRRVLQCDSVPGCHVDGSWGQWAPWLECSARCGGGVKIRTRECDNPAPQSGGRECVGSGRQQKACNTHSCTDSGPWFDWSAWSACTVSCGGGSQSRSRSCRTPPCSGMRRQSKTCNTQVCLGTTNTRSLFSEKTSCKTCHKTCPGHTSHQNKLYFA